MKRIEFKITREDFVKHGELAAFWIKFKQALDKMGEKRKGNSRQL